MCIAKDYLYESCSIKIINEEELLEIEKGANKEKVYQINLLGREPTLHPNAMEISHRLYKTKNPIRLSTKSFWLEKFREYFDKYDFPMEIE